MIRRFHPSRRCTAAAKSAPFAAPRNALVPTTFTSATPKFRAHSRNTPSASSPRAKRSGAIWPALNPPSPNRTGRRNRKHSRHRGPPPPSAAGPDATSTTNIVKVFVPQSIAANRRGVADMRSACSARRYPATLTCAAVPPVFSLEFSVFS